MEKAKSEPFTTDFCKITKNLQNSHRSFCFQNILHSKLHIFLWFSSITPQEGDWIYHKFQQWAADYIQKLSLTRSCCDYVVENCIIPTPSLNESKLSIATLSSNDTTSLMLMIWRLFFMLQFSLCQICMSASSCFHWATWPRGLCHQQQQLHGTYHLLSSEQFKQ